MISATAYLGLALAVTFTLLGVALLLAVYRVLAGPSLPDRIVALDLMAMVSAGIMAASAVASERPALLDASMITALIVFVGTAAFARYLEKGGR